jgi:hypothetical protein
VTVFPHDAAWSGSFYESDEQPIATYVDMTTVPVWDGATVSMVDLDLDVVLLRDGSLKLDDEDEFDQHRVGFGYPAEGVELALTSCEAVRRAVELSQSPFDAETPKRWFAALEGAMMAP